MLLIWIVSSLHLLAVTAASENATEYETSTSSYETEYCKNVLKKDESLCMCATLEFEIDDYDLFPNGNVYISILNLTLNESFYILENRTITICDSVLEDEDEEGEEEEKDNDNALYTPYITLVGISISIVCLFLHLVVFALVPDLRNLPGWSLAALCMCLFLGYLMQLVASSRDTSQNPAVCTAVASAIQFSFIAAFMWMSIMSFDVSVSLSRATRNFLLSSTQARQKKFGVYCACAFGVALFFTLFALFADIFDFLPQPYKPSFQSHLCWFNQKKALIAFFAGPVIVLICFNFIFFGFSTYLIYSNKMKLDADDCSKSAINKNYTMYLRLGIIMGVTWITGAIAPAFDADWLWYIYVILNSLQGLFIFIAFSCTKKVRDHLRQKFSNFRKASAISQTFQTYFSSNENSEHQCMQNKNATNST